MTKYRLCQYCLGIDKPEHMIIWQGEYIHLQCHEKQQENLEFNLKKSLESKLNGKRTNEM